MKKLLSVLITCLLLVQLSACGLNSEEKSAGTLHLNNPIDKSVTEIKVDSDNVYLTSGTMLAFQYELSIEELKNSLAESNPDFIFNVLDDKQILMISKANYPYTLFSKKAVDDDNNPIDNLCVVINESTAGNRNNDKICLPEHLTKDYFEFREDNGKYSLDCQLHDPYYNIIELQSSPTILRILPRFIRTAATTFITRAATHQGAVSAYLTARRTLWKAQYRYIKF